MDALDSVADPADVQVSVNAKLDRSGSELAFSNIFETKVEVLAETMATGKYARAGTNEMELRVKDESLTDHAQ
jgi:hypothetical protein